MAVGLGVMFWALLTDEDTDVVGTVMTMANGEEVVFALKEVDYLGFLATQNSAL